MEIDLGWELKGWEVTGWELPGWKTALGKKKLEYFFMCQENFYDLIHVA